MTTALLSVPTPHRTPFSPRPSTNGGARFPASTTVLWLPSQPLTTPLCSSSLPTSVVENDAIPISSESDPQLTDQLPPRGCKACGRGELERGCNGEGRIQGGIATVPGFSWWPIKAYRPCPGFLASGGRYQRQGQSMDEVAFGREDQGTSVGASSKEGSSKKKKKLKKLKE